MARNLALALDALGDLLRPTGIEIIKSVVRKLDPETAFFLGYGFAVAGQQFLKELESEARPDRPKK